MKKISLMLAAGVLCLSGSAFAGEKVPTSESCCRSGDANCETPYVAGCDADANVGKYCTTDDTDADSDGSSNDRIVEEIRCTNNETCFDNAGYISCVPNDLQKGECVTGTDVAVCSELEEAGAYCYNNEWRYTACNAGATCSIRENQYVDCTNPNACVKADSYCNTDGSNGGMRCDTKTGEMVEWTCDTGKTCSRADDGYLTCVSGSGDTGSECSSDEMGCISASEGWYCSNGNKMTKSCTADQVCGLKTYSGKERVACCVADGQGGYIDSQYTSDVCHTVYDGAGSGNTPGGDTCTERCASDGSIAYTCVNGSQEREPCSASGATCQMNGDKAVCVAGGGATGDGGGKNKKDDDSGCSATGAGFLLGWMGLAMLPALRRRQK